jgi:glucose/arabinose dehydrogenase
MLAAARPGVDDLAGHRRGRLRLHPLPERHKPRRRRGPANGEHARMPSDRSPLLRRAIAAATAACTLLLVAACGGGGNAPDTPPTPAITSPAAGSTFRAGDTLTFSGSATDAQDGTLPASSLSWWAELHHNDHDHPFQQPTPGASGTVTIPTRGETSDNIFYRFHLRAVDSAGQAVTVTRDVLPRKARVTLATVPPGLALTLDGQAVSGPSTFTGVVGVERDIAAADQQANGRRYRFDAWSQGGAASQTVATPSTDTTYTANFTDVGPVNNQPPTVQLSAPAGATVNTAVTLSADAADSDGSVTRVDFSDGSTPIGSDSTAPYSISWTPTTTGSKTLTARAFDNNGASTTSAAVTITVNPAVGNDTTPPTATLTAPAAFADDLTGTLAITADASDNVGVAGVEFQVDGVAIGSEDTSAPFAASIDTTQWASGQHIVRARARDAAGNRSAWASATVRFGGNRSRPAGFTQNESWVTGLANATAFAQAPDGRIFVAEQVGRLRVLKNGVLLTTPFVDLVSSIDASGERGLIGVALHPDFATNGWVYVYYTRAVDTPVRTRNNRVSRFTASGDVAAAGSEVVLADLPNLSSATNHNGGAMKFGADGKLYVAVGDNANTSTPQNLSNVFGKMLRFNDDGTIPSDNPYFAQQTGQARAIWASGLRNPFTFAVQPGTGRMHINDVGQSTWEEISLGAAGANYGWPASEGPDNIGAGVTAPLFAYRHSAASPAGSGVGGFFVGFAIAGGAFYPSSGPAATFPAGYRGNYFFADYVSKFIGLIDLANGNAAYSFGAVSGNPVDLLAGSDGALYVLTRSGVVRFSVP